jgi:hypothetical protein
MAAETNAFKAQIDTWISAALVIPLGRPSSTRHRTEGEMG